MHSLMILGCLLVGQYQGPLSGGVQNNKFDFTHESNWQPNRITNTVVNLHTTRELEVTWQAASINSSRIPPNDGKLGKSPPRNCITIPCLQSALTPNLQAVLYYGTSGKKPAGVYECGKAWPKFLPPVLKSGILLATEKGPYELEVVSTHLEDQTVYSFIQNRPFYISLELPPHMIPSFQRREWMITPNAVKSIKGIDFLLKQEWGDKCPPSFEKFQLLRPPGLLSAVRLTGSPVEPRWFLILISAGTPESQELVGTGILALHVPRD